MAKKKSATEFNLDDEYALLAASTDGDVLDTLDTVKFFIDTGNLAVNYSCSGKFVPGGIPAGRIIEAFGPEASGKSLIGSNTLYGAQRKNGWAILIDCENASNADFMKKISHLNVKHVLRYAPSSLERAFRQIHVVVRKIRDREKELKSERRPIMVVFDSLTVPPCERELKENDLPMDFNVADWKRIVGRKEQPGERAKVISAEMRKLQSMVVKEDVTVYLINQIRHNIGVMYGNPETVPGGNSVKFYSSLRFRTANRKKIEQKGIGKYAGINMQVKNIKNRMHRPFIAADDVKLYFDHGIDPISGLLNCLIEDERIKGKGTYAVEAKYLPEGKSEYKFKAKKADNTVPVKVLLDCPKLVDAETAEEVQQYLDCWASGLNASLSGAFEQKDVGLNEDGEPIESDGGDYEDDSDVEVETGDEE